MKLAVNVPSKTVSKPVKRAGLLAFSALTLLLFTAGLNGHASAAVSSWQKGVTMQPRWNTDFGSDSFKQSVNNAAADGVNYISLVVPIHQSNIYSTDVQAGGDTPTDQSLASGISYIKSKGMNVAVNIHDDPYDGQWRALINPGDKTTWFANYGNQLNHYATIAQANGAGQMVIGTEMSTMTASANTSYWQSMIQNVRSRFSGQLTYSAQHEGYMSDVQSLGFWGNLDLIGVSAYYGLGGGTPSVSSIEQQWTNYSGNLQSLSSRYGKPVIFTEVGYQSKDNSLSDPGSSYSNGGGTNMTTQSNAYQALFDYWNNQGFMNGAFLWDWNTDPNAGGTGNNDYTPQGKPAEQIMKQWFGQSAPAGGMGGGTTTTPVTNPTTPAAPSGPTTFSVSASQNGQATVNANGTTNVVVAANQSAANSLVDVEIFNASGQRVTQKYFENQGLSATPITYPVTWTPAAAGNYTVKVGVFTANWASNLYWNDAVATVNAIQPGTSGSTTIPPATTTTPPATTTTTPPATSTSTSSIPANATLNIWWPGSGVSVSGVQPFKALIDGVDPKNYNMYWQVDGGTLNQMGNNYDTTGHKESLVDLSGWNWQSSGKYTINFVAKDLSGNVITSKAVVITITH